MSLLTASRAASVGRSGARTSGVRTDIQGLRALAVSMVLVYHVDAGWLPGGFVGVDVFFVISGFLITLHLVRRPPTTPGQLTAFWGRRVRRLVPAALLVLGTTLLASRFWGPATGWGATADQTAAATGYVLNWVLAHDAVDYLASHNAPTPVQHFWSLGVEEQFYLFWPLLVAGAALVATRLRRRRQGVVLTTLAIIVVVSFCYSVHLTATDPRAAYFVTTTRIWELGVGGVLAALTWRAHGERRPAHAGASFRMGAAATGLTLIAAAAVFFSSGTPFPGWHAAVPVLGTALVIAAWPPDLPGSPGRWLARPEVQWLGDHSYTIYLWHWPLVVLAPAVLGTTSTWVLAPVVVIATLILSGLTTSLVENRFRITAAAAPPRLRPLAVGLLVLVLLTGLLHLAGTAREHADRAQLAAHTAAAPSSCRGAAALDPGARCPDSQKPSYPVNAAKNDFDPVFNLNPDTGLHCLATNPYRTATCEYGDRRSSTVIDLVGNSHSAQWLPALKQLATANHWRIRTHFAAGCAAIDVAQVLPAPYNSAQCRTWAKRTIAEVRDEHPSLVIYSNLLPFPVGTQSSTASLASYQQGETAALSTWADAGIKVLVLRSGPFPRISIPDCLATNPTAAPCTGTPGTWLLPDPVGAAVRAVGSRSVRYVDMTPHICLPTACQPIVGGVVVYFDAGHLSVTYSRSLAPYLESAVRASLRRS